MLKHLCPKTFYRKHRSFLRIFNIFTIITGVLITTESFAYASIKKLDELTRFSNKNKSFATRCGSNIKLVSKVVSVPNPVLELNLTRKTMNDAPNLNWFYVEFPVNGQAAWKNAEGIVLEVALNRASRWWFGVNIWDKKGRQYLFSPLQSMNYTEKPEQRLIPFRKLKSKQTKEPLNPAEITKIRFSGTGKPGMVRLGNICLYRKTQNKQWIDYSAVSSYGGNIFQRDEPVKLSFKTTAPAHQSPKEFQYIVSDYYGKNVASGMIKLVPGQNIYNITLDIKAPGYYEVRAYKGNTKDAKAALSCLKQKGSIPGSFGTFAIMPNTVKENVTRMLEVGERAFFGLHNSRHFFNLQELMGFPWMFIYSRWEYIETRKPVRKTSDASAPWVEKRIKQTGPLPPYIYAHTSLLAAQTGAPKWAKSDNPQKPPHYKNEKDLELFIRDYIRYHKKRCPHMKRRTYGVLWEPEIYTPEYMVNKHVPVYTGQEQLVAIQKKVRKWIKQEDPDALVLGPTSMWCYGLDWWDKFFKAGILNGVDEVSTHLYCSAPPESNKIPEKLAALRELMKKYKGHVYDIYNTEAGFKSKVGNKHKIREHAGWSVRYVMILKGEKLKRHLHFYPLDIPDKGGWGTYGICFYNGESKKFDYNTLNFSPKPALSALATCSSQLLGSTPRRHLRDWKRNIWGYVFEKKGKPVVTIWNPFRKLKIPVVVGNVDKIEVVDIMGRKSYPKVNNGLITLEIGPDPLYINGAEKDIYLSPEVSVQEVVSSPLPVIIPAQSRKISIPQSKRTKGKIIAVKSWGGLSSTIKNNVVDLRVAPGTPEMCSPVLLKYADGRTIVQWICIGSELELKTMQVSSQNGRMGLDVSLENYTNKPIKTKIAMLTDFSGSWKYQDAKVPAAEQLNIFIPFSNNIKLTGGNSKPLRIELKVKTESGIEIEEKRNIYFLSAYQPKHDAKIFPDSVHLKGKGASGKIDQADIKFAWDKKNLSIHISVKDDVFYQQGVDFSKLWAEDSIQLAFDTHPGKTELYNPLAGIYDKKITELAIAKTSKKNVVYRHVSHNPAELPLGDVSNNGFNVDIKRNEQTGLTTYDISIPWRQLGLQKVEAGKSIGISILINDQDSPRTVRKGVPLFGGILNSKDYNLFGRITLR